MTQTSPISQGTLIPHLIVDGADRAIAFYQQAFGAQLTMRMAMPNSDKVMHAQLAIGDSTLMLADLFPDCEQKDPLALKGSPVVLHLYWDNVDAVFEQAVAAGATVVMPLMDAFWGDRYGQIQDPFGHRWALAQKVRTLSPEEIMAGAEAMGCGGAS